MIEVPRKVVPDLSQSQRFLRALFARKPDDLYILIWSVIGKDEEKVSAWFQDVDEAAAYAVRIAKRKNVFVEVSLSPSDFGPHHRCAENDSAGVVGFYVEIDFSHPVHKKTNLPPTVDDCLELVREFPLPPTIILLSAHGIHVWWLLKEPWLFDDDEGRAAAKESITRLQATLRTKAEAREWTIDPTADLARVLRVAGTINHRDEPVRVEILEMDESRRYDPSDFAPYLVDPADVTRFCPTAMNGHHPLALNGHAAPLSTTFRVDDADLIARMFGAQNGAKTRALWDGDSSAHGGDDSAADEALCFHLAFWTGRDAVWMDSLFRQSGRMRQKWDEVHYADGRLYGAVTIDKAIQAMTETYKPPGVSKQGTAIAPPDPELFDPARAKALLDAATSATREDRPTVLRCLADLVATADPLTADRFADEVKRAGLSTKTAFLDTIRKVQKQTDPSLNDDEKDQETQAQGMVRLALEAGVELFHTSDQTTYATIPLGGHRETWATSSRSFRLWLQRLFHQAKGGIANAESTGAALNTLAGTALFDGPSDAVSLRTAEHDGHIYVDLCDEEWRVIDVDADGWRIATDPPIRFRRLPGMSALPEPVAGGTLDELRPFVNVDDNDWPLFKAWLRQALRPTGPYPPLDLSGEQGSAKSTTTKVARALVDPSDVPIRTAPREARDLAITAANSYVLAYDNLSHLPDWLSDAFCRLSTGGGFGTRTLYTDDEEKLFKATRPVIVNGIGDVIERPDLLDRAIPMTCPQVPEDNRLEEKVFWARFDAQHPRLFGALLDDLSRALRNLPTTRLACLPRMADFARWATAAETDSERGTFLTSYTRNRDDANALALEGSPLVDGLYRFMAGQSAWTGTALELWKGLVAIVAPKVVTSEGKTEPLKSRLPPNWPGNARALSSALRRLAPNLRKVGFDIKLDERGPAPKRDRLIGVTKMDTKMDANALAMDAKLPEVDANPPEWTQNWGMDAKDANAPHFTGAAVVGNGLFHADSVENPPQNSVSDDRVEFASFASIASTPHARDPLAIGDLVNVRYTNGDVVNTGRVVSIEYDSKGRPWVHIESSPSGWPLDQIELVERASSSEVLQ